MYTIFIISIMARTPVKTSLHDQVYKYLDYREFLKDLVAALKMQRGEFTMRYFADKAGFGSPSYLKMVMDGKRQLTNKSLDKFCAALVISGREKKYFTSLVRYNQETNPDLKARLFDELSGLRPRKTLTELTKKQIQYLTHHHYACIREMVLLDDFQENAKWIASRCLPRISPQEARMAITTLLDLGFLGRDKDGKLIQSESTVGTQAQTELVQAFNFHDAVLSKARECLSHSKQEERHFEALTIPVTPEIHKKLRQKIQHFIEDALLEVNTLSRGFKEVYQLNVQLFPVTTDKNLYVPQDDELHNAPKQENP